MIHIYIEEIHLQFKSIIGDEYIPYKNHVHRVSHLTMKLKQDVRPNDRQKIAIAAAYNDIGIWTHKTFDYLAPSISTAVTYLKENNLSSWIDEISLISDMHHKRSIYKGE